ncbi:MAG TPA: S8 family serine peptidase, partial [Thermoanaerobaculia bacterium]
RPIQNTDANLGAFELAVEAVVDAGFIVVTSANNQNQDACNLSPARLSNGNTVTSLRKGVITVGGTMIKNTTEVTQANHLIFRGNNGTAYGEKGAEPIHDSTSPVKDARWICGAGDSSQCGAAGSPGSNHGPCVSVFAPAKNITSASLAHNAQNSSWYRDRLGREDDVPKSLASGTSFSAPMVAGIAALFLQHAHAGATGEDFLRALQLNGSSGMIEDSAALPLSPDPTRPSPNLLARVVGVYAYSAPTSHTVTRNHNVTLNFLASGPPPLTYEWYRGPVGNVAQSTLTATTSSGSYTFAPATDGTFTHWVRVTASTCSNIVNYVDSGAFSVTVNAPPLTAPATASATTTSGGASVSVAWSSVTGATAYVVQRSTSLAGTYATVATVQTTNYTDAPPVQASPVAYLYRVLAKDAGNNLSAPSPADYATVKSSALFSDDPVTLNATLLKTIHLTEVRQAVDAVRAATGLAPASWPTPGALLVADFTGLRTALDQARTQMGLAAYPYNYTVVSGASLNALHLGEARQSVK